MYAFMQAIGLINDHVEDCVIRTNIERARTDFRRPGLRQDHLVNFMDIIQ